MISLYGIWEPSSGLLGFQIDSSYIQQLITESSPDEFLWKQLPSLHLSEGSHILTISNLKGLNAINIAVLAPSGANTYRSHSNKLPIYVFERTDF
jgi:hypothetical protein